MSRPYVLLKITVQRKAVSSLSSYLVDDVVECTHGLLNRGRDVRPVRVDDVKVVDSVPLQRRLGALDHVLPAQASAEQRESFPKRAGFSLVFSGSQISSMISVYQISCCQMQGPNALTVHLPRSCLKTKGLNTSLIKF